MKCTKCGKENRNEAVFCRFCGEEIENVEQPAQPAAAQEPVKAPDKTVPQDDFIGHEEIREQLRKFINKQEQDKQRELYGSEPDLTNHVVLFSGNTGTGKYTLANWFVSKLKEKNLLNGKVKEFYAKELKKQFEDESAINAFLNQNNYGLLIIRDVHFDTDYLNELLRALSMNKSGTICVCLGFKDKLDVYFKDNPESKRGINDFYELKDYTDITLTEILEAKLKDKNFKYDKEAAETLLQLVIEENNKEGKVHENGWLIEKDIIPEIIEIQSERLSKMGNPSKDDFFTILSEDIPAKNARRTEEEIFAELNSLIGLTKLKEEIKSRMDAAKAAKEQGEDLDLLRNHMVLYGNPGTGKTTVARMLGELFNAIGLLPSSKIVEVDRSKLVGEYVGSTAIKVNKYCDKAMGGVLFIDEAYALCNDKEKDSYGKEAVDTLVKRLEDDHGKFIAIIAGYKDDINRFLVSINDGLPSRFPEGNRLELPDYNEAELIQIFKKFAGKKYVLDAEAEKALEKVVKHMYTSRSKKFGNAREIRNLISTVTIRQSSRIMKIPQDQRTDEVYKTIKAEDFQEAE